MSYPLPFGFRNKCNSSLYHVGILRKYLAMSMLRLKKRMWTHSFRTLLRIFIKRYIYKLIIVTTIPRILHCHVNPAIQRFIGGQYPVSIVDSVIAKKTFSYVNHTDNSPIDGSFLVEHAGESYLGETWTTDKLQFRLRCCRIIK